MKTRNLLANNLNTRWPISRIWLVAHLSWCQIIDKCIKPDIHHVVRIIWNWNSPRMPRYRPGDTELGSHWIIFQPPHVINQAVVNIGTTIDCIQNIIFDLIQIFSKTKNVIFFFEIFKNSFWTNSKSFSIDDNLIALMNKSFIIERIPSRINWLNINVRS